MSQNGNKSFHALVILNVVNSTFIKLSLKVVVCVHGLHGFPEDFLHFGTGLTAQYDEIILGSSDSNDDAGKFTSLHLLKSSANMGVLTLDGISMLGGRLCDEVRDYFTKNLFIDDGELMKKFKESGASTLEVHFSVVAHSLGGLISRFALRTLLGDNSPVISRDEVQAQKGESLWKIVEEAKSKLKVELQLKPLSFMTVCSPHCGSRRASKETFSGALFPVMLELYCSHLSGKTGRELFLMDGDPETDEKSQNDEATPPKSSEPLLWKMAKSDGPFMKSLSHFETHTLVACLQNDVPVGYCSAAVSSTHPHPDIAFSKSTANELIVRSISGFQTLGKSTLSVNQTSSQSTLPQSIAFDSAQSLESSNQKSDFKSDVGFVVNLLGENVESFGKKISEVKEEHEDRVRNFFMNNLFKSKSSSNPEPYRLDMIEEFVEHPGTNHHIDGLLDKEEDGDDGMDADQLDIQRKSTSKTVSNIVSGLVRSITKKTNSAESGLEIVSEPVENPYIENDDDYLKIVNELEDAAEKSTSKISSRPTLSSVASRLLSTKRATDLLRSGNTIFLPITSNPTIQRLTTKKKSQTETKPLPEVIYRTDSIKDSLYPPLLMKELHKTTHSWRRINLHFGIASSIWWPVTHALAPGKEIPFVPESVRVLARHSGWLLARVIVLDFEWCLENKGEA
ncbi:hypothetical protein HK098_002632 [Nowakowskiella sp. JEL0407]|nr:hypothetical protein HK098_002632 [Nowakowskiella sp. JEL0407]